VTTLIHSLQEARLVKGHKVDECPLRKVHCQYCNLKIRYKEKFLHEQKCGAITETCPICKKNVLRREQDAHPLVCQDPSKNPGQPFTFNREPPPALRRSVYLCPYENCKTPLAGYDELQVHIIIAHSEGDLTNTEIKQEKEATEAATEEKVPELIDSAIVTVPIEAEKTQTANEDKEEEEVFLEKKQNPSM